MDKFIIRKRKSSHDDDDTGADNQKSESDNNKSIISARPSTSTQKTKKIKSQVKRKYQENYLLKGFSWVGEENCPKPHCLICDEILSNESMVPSKLERHFSTKHKNYANKSIDYFKEVLKSKKQQQKKFTRMVTTSDKAQIASCAVAEILAQKRKSHLTAESVILPACRKIVKIMFGDEAEKEVMKIPLSDNTISRRIDDMSQDIEQQIIIDIHSCNMFSLQLDESTDITGKAQLITFVRYVKYNDIINQYLFCKEIPEGTTGKDIFDVVNKYFTDNNIKWQSCISICSDGAASMTGSIKGFTTLAKKENCNITTNHCFLHRQALIAKGLTEDLNEVLQEVVKIVNYIKTKPKQNRIFENLCESMNSNHKVLLKHTEIRWLSRGRVLSRVFELREELKLYFTSDTGASNFSKILHNDIWIAKLAFLADLFALLNELNLSLQGKNENTLHSNDKIKAFKDKLKLWITYVKKDTPNLEMFSLLNSNKHKTSIITSVFETLTKISELFEKYFPSIDTSQFDWVRNPFQYTSEPVLNLKEKEELIEIKNNRDLQISFENKTISQFWTSLRNDFKLISKKAIEILLPFSTSYLCEQAFSALTEIKSKKRGRLISIDEEMRLCLSSVRPRINEICSKKQSQISH